MCFKKQLSEILLMTLLFYTASIEDLSVIVITLSKVFPYWSILFEKVISGQVSDIPTAPVSVFVFTAS